MAWKFVQMFLALTFLIANILNDRKINIYLSNNENNNKKTHIF